MDVIFNCPHCQQEIEVDSSGAGAQVECPNCGESIVIPDAETVAPRVEADAASAQGGVHPVNPIASSAAAKIEMHLRVPTHQHTESLIAKPLQPLDAAAKADIEKKIRVKTIRHTDCIEVGHDKFDEMVTTFLVRIGESNIISINTLSYTFLDIGSQKLLTDYGLLIVYRG